MKNGPNNPFANHNKDFAQAVIEATIYGWETFEFNNTIYRTNKYINDVRRDLNNNYYSVTITTEY